MDFKTELKETAAVSFVTLIKHKARELNKLKSWQFEILYIQ